LPGFLIGFSQLICEIRGLLLPMEGIIQRFDSEW
jgi:hypothetical protein